MQGSQINRVVDQNTKNKESHRLSYFKLHLPELSKCWTQYSIKNPGSMAITVMLRLNDWAFIKVFEFFWEAKSCETIVGDRIPFKTCTILLVEFE